MVEELNPLIGIWDLGLAVEGSSTWEVCLLLWHQTTKTILPIQLPSMVRCATPLLTTVRSSTDRLLGIIGLTKADANSYGPLGIRINAICPGYVETPLLTNIMSRDPASPLAVDLSRTPLKRLATMEEVADAIVLLASPMNSYMQGASMICDGGFTSN
jgi:hypothetical protein